jgi:glycosyltransferase involved in cell wall biosynthesis
VIIPARNEAHQIAGCVERCARRRCVPGEIVVDDGSTDGTADVVRGLASPAP